MTSRNFKTLKEHIDGQEFSLAKRLGIVTDGNKRNDPEHHQPCPVCRAGDDRFWFYPTKRNFYCRQCGFKGDVIDLIAGVRQISKNEAYDLIADYAGFGNKVTQQSQKKNRQRFQNGTVKKTEYIYEDADGKPWHNVVRTDGIDASTGKPDKMVSQWKMVDGRWEKGAPDIKHPYRLSELLQAEINEVWIVEGEKVADKLHEVLFGTGTTNTAVTTSPGGSQNGRCWEKILQRHSVIAEKVIRIFPDNDEPGMKYARTVATAFLEANPSVDVKIVELPGLPEKGDFVDWHAGFVAEGNSDSVAIFTLSDLCASAEPVTLENIPTSKSIVLATTEKIGIAVLDSFLQQIEQIPFAESEEERLGHKDYYIGSIDHLFMMARGHRWDIGMKNGIPHFFTGEFWQRIDKETFPHFLQAVGIKQGIPRKVIKDHLFVEKLVKQFASEARFPVPITNNTPKINLRNCTLHFLPNGMEQKSFDKQDGLTYQLHYDYDLSASAPLFKKFLDDVVPDDALQKLLFQYIGYIFLRDMKLDKILFLYGGGANGKSVFLNIIRALIGTEQCCEFSLEGITKSEAQRAELGNYLLNVSAEISTRMAKDIFKKIASREPLQARSLYKQPFTLREYATSIFAMNDLPKEVELTDAFFRRFIIVPFSARIPEVEQDTDLSQKIIDNEMSGVLNHVVEGMMSLISNRKFDIPASAQGAVDQFRQESDSVSRFLDDHKYRPSVKGWKSLGEMHDTYEKYCADECLLAVGKTAFGQRLRKLGFNVIKRGHEKLTVVYAEIVDADCADNAD